MNTSGQLRRTLISKLRGRTCRELLKLAPAYAKHLWWHFKKKTWLTFDVSMFSDRGFFTWHRRPKYAYQIAPPSVIGDTFESVGIVIQGPIRHRNNFTLETCKLYQKNFPGVHIVLSTWKDESQSSLSRFSDLGVSVVVSDKPNSPGPGNVNYQIASSLAGLQEVKGFGCTRVLKTRTDQRIYSPAALKLLAGILDCYPAHGHAGNGSRIVITTENTYLARFFSGSDFIQYGAMKDVEQYFDVPEAEKSDDLAPEQILGYNFVKRSARTSSVAFSRQAWEDAIGINFAFVDMGQIDLFWYKYSSREHLFRGYKRPDLLEPLTLGEWLRLVSKQLSR